MFGWFSGKKNENKKYTPSESDKRQAFYDSLSPVRQELYDLLPDIGEHNPGVETLIRKALHDSDDAELKLWLLGKAIPSVPPHVQERINDIGKRSAWAKLDDIADAGYSRGEPKKDTVFPGWFKNGDNESILQFSGEGHLLTIAPTGAGKGQGHIIPALLDYKGPVIVLDPKGENYEETAWRRRWCGDVFKWAPFDDDTDCFNPLDFVDGFDDARVLADLAIDSSNSKDPFWDNSARELLIGFIMYVKKTAKPGQQNMREVYSLLTQPKEKFEKFLTKLKTLKDERLTDLSHIIQDQPEKLRMSIFQVLRTQLGQWCTEEIDRATHTTTDGFSLENIMGKQATADMYATYNPDEPVGPIVEYHQNKDGGRVQAFVRGHGDSIFLVIPQEQMGSYASVLRVIIGTMLNEVTKAVAKSNKWRKENTKKDAPRIEDTPIMFLLDELPQLGYMDIIERIAPIARSSRIRLWLFAQSLDQLTVVYPQANTLLAAARMKLFFKPGDLDTAKYISEHLGEVEDLFGNKTLLATPQELMGPKYRDHQIVIARDALPIKSRLRLKYQDPELLESEELFRSYWDEQDDRKDLSGRLREASEGEAPATDE